MENESQLILSIPACFWDGIYQLRGELELHEQAVIFRFANFQDTHLNLVIPLNEIEKAEEFLVFGLARNGLKIESRSGGCDMFVLEEGAAFKKALKAQQQKAFH